MTQVPAGNAPGYPAPSMYGYFPFYYSLPPNQSFNIQTGFIHLYNIN